MQDDALIDIGRIVRAHGIRGEVKVQLWSGNLDSLEHLAAVRLRDRQGRITTKSIELLRSDGKHVRAAFAGIRTRNDAEALVGCDLVVTRDELRPLEDDEYFQYQLIGLQVFDTEGQPVGEVVDVRDNPGHALLVIRRGTSEQLVPAVAPFVERVDLEGGTLVLRVIEGLLDS